MDDATAIHGDEDDEERIERHQPHDDEPRGEERLPLDTRLVMQTDGMPRCERICDGEDGQIHDVVVRGIRGHGDAQPAADGGRDAARAQRSTETQREQREDPRRQQIEVPEQVCSDVRRATERDAGEESPGCLCRTRSNVSA